MEAVVGLDTAVAAAAEKESQMAVRKMVMDSYQDMLDGKGKDHREFFAEMEDRYRRANV